MNFICLKPREHLLGVLCTCPRQCTLCPVVLAWSPTEQHFGAALIAGDLRLIPYSPAAAAVLWPSVPAPFLQAPLCRPHAKPLPHPTHHCTPLSCTYTLSPAAAAVSTWNVGGKKLACLLMAGQRHAPGRPAHPGPSHAALACAFQPPAHTEREKQRSS